MEKQPTYSMKDLGKENKMSGSDVAVQISRLEGKTLTIVDASIENERQLKAIKDLIRKAFNEQITYVYGLCYPDTRILTRDEVNSTVSGGVESMKKEVA